MKFVLTAKSIFFTFSIMFFLTGCASFTKSQLPIVDLEKLPEGSKKPTVSYSFTSGVDLFGKHEHDEKLRKILEAEFVEVLNESGYFASISPNGQGDLSIQVRLVNTGNPAAMIPAFITGFSLFIIPSWVSDNYETTTKVQIQNKEDYNYSLTDSMVTVQWLPMIVVAPFKNPINTSKEVRRNIWKNLIIKMQKDGLLPQPLSSSHTMIFFKIKNLENT